MECVWIDTAMQHYLNARFFFSVVVVWFTLGPVSVLYFLRVRTCHRHKACHMWRIRKAIWAFTVVCV